MGEITPTRNHSALHSKPPMQEQEMDDRGPIRHDVHSTWHTINNSLKESTSGTVHIDWMKFNEDGSWPGKKRWSAKVDKERIEYHQNENKKQFEANPPKDAGIGIPLDILKHL